MGDGGLSYVGVGLGRRHDVHDISNEIQIDKTKRMEWNKKTTCINISGYLQDTGMEVCWCFFYWQRLNQARDKVVDR